MTVITRRNSHLEAEAEEETCQIDRRMISTGVRFLPADNAPKKKTMGASPKTVTPPVAQAPHDPLSCDFDLVNQAEAEEHSLALDRRQMSVAEAEAMGGKRRAHAQVAQPASYGVETPQNSHHHLAGLAEAEEMAWGMDRQVSAAGTVVLPAPRRMSWDAATPETTTESAKEALDRRCSHTLVASAEAEELAYALDRQASVAAGSLVAAC